MLHPTVLFFPHTFSISALDMWLYWNCGLHTNPPKPVICWCFVVGSRRNVALVCATQIAEKPDNIIVATANDFQIVFMFLPFIDFVAKVAHLGEMHIPLRYKNYLCGYIYNRTTNVFIPRTRNTCHLRCQKHLRESRKCLIFCVDQLGLEPRTSRLWVS